MINQKNKTHTFHVPQKKSQKGRIKKNRKAIYQHISENTPGDSVLDGEMTLNQTLGLKLGHG